MIVSDRIGDGSKRRKVVKLQDEDFRGDKAGGGTVGEKIRQDLFRGE